MNDKRGRGRPPADDPAVDFKLNQSTRDAVLAHAEWTLRQSAGLEYAAKRPEAINAGTTPPPLLEPPTPKAVVAEARRLIKATVEEALDQSPRLKVRRASIRGTATQLREAADLMKPGGLLDRLLYVALPDWWREQIDEYEAREGEEN